MDNSSGIHQEPTQLSHASSPFNGVGGGNPINESSVPENSSAAPSLMHNPGLSTEWTAEEQSILEEGLAIYASESNIIRYAKIAIRLPYKTVRDVAFRCRWMSKKENSKRRKEGHNLTRKNKDKKEKFTAAALAKSSHLSAQPSFSTVIHQEITMGNDIDGILYNAIGGDMGHLLKQNAQAFEQISANFATHQIHQNIPLFCQARDNILKILNSLSIDVPEKMKQMPPLTGRMNEELANSILPPSRVSMQP